jgi:hypothetical protein
VGEILPFSFLSPHFNDTEKKVLTDENLLYGAPRPSFSSYLDKD